MCVPPPGLPVSQDYIVHPEDDLSAAADAIQTQLGARVALEPLNQGSAIGVQLLPNGGTSPPHCEGIEYGSCLVEPYIEGREMTVGMLQLQDERIVHPVIEITRSERGTTTSTATVRDKVSMSFRPIPQELPVGRPCRIRPSSLGPARPIKGRFHRDARRRDFSIRGKRATWHDASQLVSRGSGRHRLPV